LTAIRKAPPEHRAQPPAQKELPDRDIANPIALDIPTHLKVSCCNPFDNDGEAYDRVADE
jgi:hypothetical protein